MVKKKLKIIWDDEAKYALRRIYNYIKNRASVERARKVRAEIVANTKSLNNFPEKFEEELTLQSEEGNYRYKVSGFTR